jgi:3-hydroxyacyl-[acyl-carrier-protein] dehydratase
MGAATTFTVPAGHPAFAGHFPGAPVMPGVLLLDEVLRALEPETVPAVRWNISAAKFLKPVLPGETLQILSEAGPNGSVRFTVLRRGIAVAQGSLVRAPVSLPDGDVR